MAPTPVLLPGKSHGWRNLVGCSPWGRWELDTTQWLHFHFSLSCIGEGNGNPLQCSCLENPRDGGDWCAAALPSLGSHRVRHDWSDSAAAATAAAAAAGNSSEWGFCSWIRLTQRDQGACDRRYDGKAGLSCCLHLDIPSVAKVEVPSLNLLENTNIYTTIYKLDNQKELTV